MNQYWIDPLGKNKATIGKVSKTFKGGDALFIDNFRYVKTFF